MFLIFGFNLYKRRPNFGSPHHIGCKKQKNVVNLQAQIKFYIC